MSHDVIRPCGAGVALPMTRKGGPENLDVPAITAVVALDVLHTLSFLDPGFQGGQKPP